MITYIYHVIETSKSKILEAIQALGGQEIQYEKKAEGWEFFKLGQINSLIGYGRNLLAIKGDKEDVFLAKSGLEEIIGDRLLKI